MKCVVILSSKCAGSTLVQGMLCGGRHAKHVRRTRHHESETLYWVKAAAMLGLPQEPMVRSELPMAAERGEAELRRLVAENSGGVDPNLTGWDLAVAGWRALCEAHAPVLVEKSPHHLRQPSALRLLADCVEALPEVETRLVALVRNPLAVICSAYRRWGYPPAAMEEEWRATYGNLASLPPALSSRLTIVRYEELLASPSVLEDVFRFCGDAEGWARSELRRDRAEGWRGDRGFGHRLSPATSALARDLGYGDDELVGRNDPLWPIRRATWIGYRTARTAAGNALAEVRRERTGASDA